MAFMDEDNDICADQGGWVERSWMRSMTFARVKSDRFSIPIIDAGGNGSKIPAVLSDSLRLPARAPRAQERNPHIIIALDGIRCCVSAFPGET